MSEPLEPDLTITTVRNGWLLAVFDGVEVVERDDSQTEAENDVTLLSEVAYHLGMTGSRYDPQRVFVGLRPGDKHHDYHPQPCAECLCQCDPDQSTPEERP